MKKNKDGEGIKMYWKGVNVKIVREGLTEMTREQSFRKGQGAGPADRCLGDERSDRGKSKPGIPQTEMSLSKSNEEAGVGQR